MSSGGFLSDLSIPISLAVIAESAAYVKGRNEGAPYRGYYFRILARQGKNALGGAYNYVVNGRMIAGFAMVAYPAEYGKSGVMTFIVSRDGAVYQKDLGPNTAALARGMTAYNPDSSWAKVPPANSQYGSRRRRGTACGRRARKSPPTCRPRSLRRWPAWTSG